MSNGRVNVIHSIAGLIKRNVLKWANTFNGSIKPYDSFGKKH